MKLKESKRTTVIHVEAEGATFNIVDVNITMKGGKIMAVTGTLNAKTESVDPFKGSFTLNSAQLNEAQQLNMNVNDPKDLSLASIDVSTLIELIETTYSPTQTA